MANKILKTLTLPNAQGEPVTYELHPEWDNIEGKPDFDDLGGGVGEEYIVNGIVKGEIFNDYENNIASGVASHAEGGSTQATNLNCHAEGSNTKASGMAAHAEGAATAARGMNSHAEGSTTIATGNNSHAEGQNTIASAQASHAQGRYNIEDTSLQYAHIVGNGTADTARSNAHTLDWSGNAWYAGSITATKLILGPESYGTSLPETGVEGQIFFLLGGSSGTATDDGNGIITLG